MKYFKNRKLLALGIAILLAGAASITTAILFRTPTREITRAEFHQLLQSQTLHDARVTPTPYTGIYEVEADHAGTKGKERVVLSTHMEEAEVKRLLDQSGTKIDIPGQGTRAQWVNIICTLLAGGFVVTILLYQTSIGKGRNTH